MNISPLERNVLLLICLLIIAIICTVLYYVIFNSSNQRQNTEPATCTSDHEWFKPREKWYARQPNSNLTYSNEKYRPLKMVIIAHTVSTKCTAFVECAAGMRDVQDYAMLNKGYGDIFYNFVVGGDGCVYEGRGWKVQGAHTRGFNNISIGIAFIGVYSSAIYPDMRITPEQVANTQKLLNLGVDEGYLSPDYVVKPHCEVRADLKSSPGDIVYREIVKWPHYSNISNKCDKCKCV